jgi:hypothetical protein
MNTDQNMTAVRGTYVSVGIAFSTFAEEDYIACIFSEIAIL